MPSVFVAAPWAEQGDRRLEVDLSNRKMPVSDLVQKINAHYGVPSGEQRLMARGRLLNPEKEDGTPSTLFDYGIGRNEVIQVLRPKALPKQEPRPDDMSVHPAPSSSTPEQAPQPAAAVASPTDPSPTPSESAATGSSSSKEEGGEKPAPVDASGLTVVSGKGKYKFIGQSSADDNVVEENLPEAVACRWFRIWKVEEATGSGVHAMDVDQSAVTAASRDGEAARGDVEPEFAGRTVFSKRGAEGLLQCGNVLSRDSNGCYTIHWIESDEKEEGVSSERVSAMVEEADQGEKPSSKSSKTSSARVAGESFLEVLVEHQIPPPASTLLAKSCYKLLRRPLAGAEADSQPGLFSIVENQATVQMNLKGLKFEVMGGADLPAGEYAVGVTVQCNEAECKQCRAKSSVDNCKTCGCQVCDSKLNLEKLLLCDECNLAYHINCLEGQTHSAKEGNMDAIPDGDWYCPKCFNDPRKVAQGKIIAKELKGKKVPASALTTKNWGGGMACVGRTKVCSSVKPGHFGAIPGVSVGSKWQYRIEVSEDGVHRPHVAGMAGTPAVGCQSIVLSGGYSDDEDEGEAFLYTGSGGRDLSGNKRTAKQSMDQELTRMNAALAKNCNRSDWRKGKPVRVIRASKLCKTSHGAYAPGVPEGWAQSFRYDGLYKVVDCGATEGKSGHRVYRYLLRRDDPEPAPWTTEGASRPADLRSDAAKNEKEKRRREAEENQGGGGGGGGGAVAEGSASDEAMAEDGELRALIAEDTANAGRWETVLESAKSSVPIKHQSDVLEKVQEEFVCIVCMGTVSKPTTTPCGHNYCQACFKRGVKYGESSHGESKCLSCRAVLEDEFTSKAPVNEKLRAVITKLFGS